MRVLVLGSEGTLGRTMCNYLEEKQIEVVRWDVKLGEHYDLRDAGNIDHILPEVDYVIFMAFDVGGAKYNVHTKEFLDNNMRLIINTFDSLMRINKPFIYTSSTMYNMLSNPYGVLKRLSEFYVHLLNGVNVRLWNVYGHENVSEKSHVVPDFIHQAITQGVITMNTSGEEQRQFIYCEDLAAALYEIMNNHALYKSQGDIDISSYKWVTIANVASTIKDVFLEKYGTCIKIQKGSGENNHTCINEPSKSLLNEFWKPSISLEEGISVLIEEQMKGYKGMQTRIRNND